MVPRAIGSERGVSAAPPTVPLTQAGIEYALAHGVIDADPSSVAHFLRTTKGLSKKRIGDYLGERSDVAGQVHALLERPNALYIRTDCDCTQSAGAHRVRCALRLQLDAVRRCCARVPHALPPTRRGPEDRSDHVHIRAPVIAPIIDTYSMQSLMPCIVRCACAPIDASARPCLGQTSSSIPYLLTYLLTY